MRNTLYLLAFLIGTIQLSIAQGQLQAGINGGIPTSETGVSTNFALAMDLVFLTEITGRFDAGISTGYIIAFGEELPPGSINIELFDITFIPFAASGRFELASNFRVGADLGYAIGTNRFGRSGLYIAPQASYSFTENIAIITAYRVVTQNDSVGAFHMVSAGVLFGFNI
ncbi:MAG: hypothetical protein KJO39_11800 [Bacteroidia bacterium]|nr:hypothetical protein [Bacteroidia bacterium]NNF31766.1 hypothetical protein [Flavobacteriaceae bacterium]NNK55280.1 hypothetical protein [Flavobacteriaceae bacterium]NNM10275.1 hypothetical protein [Flavobacteriaceae bacterium]